MLFRSRTPVGYIHSNNNIYLFYQLNVNYTVELFKNTSQLIWTTIHEMITLKKVTHFQIHPLVTELFIANPLLSLLYNEGGVQLVTPIIGYISGGIRYLLFISSIGIPKEMDNSIGPFYKFYEYDKAVSMISNQAETGVTRFALGIYNNLDVTKQENLNKWEELYDSLSINTTDNPSDIMYVLKKSKDYIPLSIHLVN
jgi:hypothetical protein